MRSNNLVLQPKVGMNREVRPLNSAPNRNKNYARNEQLSGLGNLFDFSSFLFMYGSHFYIGGERKPHIKHKLNKRQQRRRDLSKISRRDRKLNHRQ